MSQWKETRTFNKVNFIPFVKNDIVDMITITNCPGDIHEIDKMLYFHLIEKEFLNKSYEHWLKFDLINLKEYLKNEYRNQYEI